MPRWWISTTTQFEDRPVRMAVLLQPVASPKGRGMAVIQVAETLELRHTLARQILVDTVWRQARAGGGDRAGGAAGGAARHPAGAPAQPASCRPATKAT